MANTTDNIDALVRAKVYSQILLEAFEDGMLPEGVARDITDFPDGKTLHIPTLGDVVIRDIEENKPRPLDAIDTGYIELSITESKGAGWYLTDESKEDSYLVDQMDATVPGKMIRGIKEEWEASLLATANKQTLGNHNRVNRFAHRFVASGTGQQLTLEDIFYAKAALDKALVSDTRIAIIDGINELTLNNLAGAQAFSYNPHFEGIVETGFGKNMRFFRNIAGFDIYLSNRLPTVDSESVDTTTAGTVAAPSGAGVLADEGIVCQFMAVGDEDEMPYMTAMRRQPYVEGVRNGTRGRDELYARARWGHAMQRSQSLVSVLASALRY